MSEVKWIKITTNIFDDEKIQLIEALPESDSILVIWLKLLTLSGRSNNGGLVLISDKVPYTKEMLSIIFRRKQAVIDLALITFEKFGMVEILDNNVILISNWEKHQNIDGMEKIKLQNKVRQQRFRDEKKILLGVSKDSVCVYCGKKASGVDHIIPTSKGGKNIESNYVPCCLSCNRIKNNKPLVDFLNFNKEMLNDNSVCNNINLQNHIKLNNVTNRYEITLHNAIDKELELEKELDIERKKKVIKEIVVYFDNTELDNLFKDFLKQRKSPKVKNTERAVNGLLKILKPFSDDIKTEMIEKSIISGWASVFELKNNGYNTKEEKPLTNRYAHLKEK